MGVILLHFIFLILAETLTLEKIKVFCYDCASGYHRKQGVSTLGNIWAERIAKAIQHLRRYCFSWEEESYSLSGRGMSHYPVVLALQEWGGITLIGRICDLKPTYKIGLRGEVRRLLRRHSLGQPQLRYIYLLDPERLDQIGRWVAVNPPLVLRRVRSKNRIVLDNEQFPFPEFLWSEYSGGVRVGH